MPYRFVYVNDEQDEQAERENRLTFAEAERRSGWYYRKLRGLIDDGVIRTVTYGGRTYVDGQSLARATQNPAYQITEAEYYRYLLDTGQRSAADAFAREIDAKNHERVDAMFGPRQETLETVARQVKPDGIDPGESFLQKAARLVRKTGGRS